MRENKSNTPKLRFPGFTDPWEQRKFGGLFTESNEQSSELEILSVSVARGIYPASESDRETNPGASLANYKVVRKGDLAYNSMRMWQGALDFSSYEGIVSPAYVVARPCSNAKPRFLAHTLKRPELLFQYQRFSQGDSKDTQVLKFDKFAEIAVNLPCSPDEQEKIGAIFDLLDDLITLHQRKSEHLQKMKKGLLQKMFPKDGETVPEIRFPGFTDPWEQRKFSEAFSFLQNNTLSRSDLSSTEGQTRDVHYGDILTKFGEVLDAERVALPRIADDDLAERLTCQLLSDGDVVVADTAEDEAVGKCCELRGCADRRIVSGLHTMACRPRVEFAPGYLGYYLNSAAFHNQLLPLMQGIKVISVSKSAIEDTNVRNPSLPEQEAIGSFFWKLDDLITLHQRKLEHLQNLKKGLLQQMFI